MIALIDAMGPHVEPTTTRSPCGLRGVATSFVALVALALASCSSGPAWQSSSSASTCTVSSDVYWTPASPDAGPPEESCFPVDVPIGPDGSAPCTVFAATGSDPCRIDQGTLAVTDDERQEAFPLETGAVCRIAQVPLDAAGACAAPGFCVERGVLAAPCALRFAFHPAVSPTVPWRVRLRCAWPSACP